jgi:Fur family transcriptional regulator, zinc uptake regulator
MMPGSSGSDTPPDRSRRTRAPILPGSVLDELIVETLSGTDVPLSAYAIVDQLRDKGRTGNVMAIYRSLDRLTKRDVVERVESLSAYRLRTASQAVLMACSHCGATTPLPILSEFQSIEQAVREAGFALDKLALEAVGVCEQCRQG